MSEVEPFGDKVKVKIIPEDNIFTGMGDGTNVVKSEILLIGMNKESLKDGDTLYHYGEGIKIGDENIINLDQIIAFKRA